MNKAQYTENRKALMNEAQKLIDGNQIDQANAKMKEVEVLDNQFENAAREKANFNAVYGEHKSAGFKNLYGSSVGFEVSGGTVIDTFGKENNMNNRASQEYKEAFVRTLQGKASTDMVNLVTTETGAAVIPTSTMDQIIQNIQKQQGILSRVRMLQIPGNLSIPLSDINTPAAWHTEGTEIADSSKEPTTLSLKGYELAKLFSLSAATQAMSIPQYENYLTQELQRTMGDALNNAVFSGNGTAQPTGINALTYTADNSVTTAVKNVSYEKLVAALGLLASNFRQGATWIMNSKTFYEYIATITDAQGRPIFVSDINNVPVMKILGKELILDDFCPDDTIFLGDCQFYFLNFSAPISIEMSREAGFTKGTIVYRSLCVVDGKPLPSGAFVKITIPQA